MQLKTDFYTALTTNTKLSNLIFTAIEKEEITIRTT